MARHHRSPPNSAAAGSEVESVPRSGSAKRAAGCRRSSCWWRCRREAEGHRSRPPCCFGGGAQTGGACATGRPLPGGLCRWLEPALLCSGSEACVDEPGPETTGAMGDGPAATVAMSGATWAAVVMRVCGRCGVVGGLVRDAGGSNRDVGGSERGVGGRDRGVGGRDRGVGGRVVFRRRFDVSIADDGWEGANGDCTDRAMEQRAAANLERSVPAAVGVLESGFRVFESSTWRPTGSTSSPWVDKKSKPRMGLRTAARKNVTKTVRSPNERRRRMVPHVGIDLPSAPESCGLAGCAFE
jgi:hypothetical protein